ncbi:MAG: MATE family efflux transporter [Planctomycetota bacterium]|nr:MATE family efflux transporter [Planctomycetota bacterium]
MTLQRQVDESCRTSQNWFFRPAGPIDVLSVAWPLMLSTGLFSITIFVDRMMLYAYSDQAAAGAMGAGTMFWAVTCLPVGIFGFTSTFVAQYVGAGRMDRAMRSVIQGIMMAALTGPILFLLAWQSPQFFGMFHEPELVGPESSYFQWVSVGAWATIVTAPLVGLFAGTNKTRLLLLCDFVVTILNFILDLLLIFGFLGFPRLGIVGAALATSIALVTKLILLLIAANYLSWPGQKNSDPNSTVVPKRVSLFYEKWQFDWTISRRLLHFGWPAGISTLAEAITFSVIMMVVGQLGERAMAATTLALGVNMLAFIPMMGLGLSIGVLVGQYLTSGRLELAKRSVRSGLLIAMAYSTFFAILYGVFPREVLSVYSIGAESYRFDEMKDIVIPILWFIAVYCIFDGIQIVFVGALKGAGDTSFVLIGHIVSGVVTIGTGKLLGDYFYDGGGLYWWWGVMTAWVLVMAVMFASRYLHGGWQNKRVIEPDLGNV